MYVMLCNHAVLRRIVVFICCLFSAFHDSTVSGINFRKSDRAMFVGICFLFTRIADTRSVVTQPAVVACEWLSRAYVVQNEVNQVRRVVAGRVKAGSRCSTVLCLLYTGITGVRVLAKIRSGTRTDWTSLLAWNASKDSTMDYKSRRCTVNWLNSNCIQCRKLGLNHII